MGFVALPMEGRCDVTFRRLTYEGVERCRVGRVVGNHKVSALNRQRTLTERQREETELVEKTAEGLKRRQSQGRVKTTLNWLTKHLVVEQYDERPFRCGNFNELMLADAR